MTLTTFLTWLICGIIVLLFTVTLIKLNGVSGKFKAQKDEYEKKKREASYRTENIDPEKDILLIGAMPVNAELLNKMEDEFNDNCAEYNSWSQVISVFPMLGILGTVAGLMTAGEEIMTASIGLALITTLFGIIAAIILKFFDSFGAYKSANEVQNIITRLNNSYDKQVQRQALIKK